MLKARAFLKARSVLKAKPSRLKRADQLLNRFGGPLRFLRYSTLQVSPGDHSDEPAHRGLLGREWPLAVATRGDAALDGLACPPVLSVGYVPELCGVGGVEALRRQGLAREEPLALDAGTGRGYWREAMRQHVVGVGAYEEVREDLVVVDLPLLAF